MIVAKGSGGDLNAAEELTESEQGLKRVYEYLKEQADALRAASLAKRLASTRKEKEASLAKRESSVRPRASDPGPGGSRPVKRPTMAPVRTSVGASGGATPYDRADRVSLPHSPSMGGSSDSDTSTVRSTARPSSMPKRPSHGPRPSANREAFSIPKRAPGAAGVPEMGAIPRRDPQAFKEAPPEPVAAADTEPFPFVEGKSLDRGHFPADGIIMGVKQQWDSKDAQEPLVIPLEGFGQALHQKNTVAIQASVRAEAKRFTINICAGPMSDSESNAAAPDNILVSVNPRRVYRQGCIMVRGRRDGQWLESQGKTVKLQGLPPIFNACVTIIIRLTSNNASVLVDGEAVAEIPLADAPDTSSEDGGELAVHLPVVEETMGFPEECVVHEVWWGRMDQLSFATLTIAPRPLPPEFIDHSAALSAPPAADLSSGGGARASLPPPAAAAPSAMGLPVRPRVSSYGSAPPAVGGVGGLEGEDTGLGGSLSRLGGLLGAGFGAAAGGAGGSVMAVVQVANVPEANSPDEAEQAKADILSIFSSVGSGASEVHLKEESSIAFVVLAEPGDLQPAITQLDWFDYRGKKLRMSRSNRRSFTSNLKGFKAVSDSE